MPKQWGVKPVITRVCNSRPCRDNMNLDVFAQPLHSMDTVVQSTTGSKSTEKESDNPVKASHEEDTKSTKLRQQKVQIMDQMTPAVQNQ
eukprot:TRINITY_DN9894_c0_g1_i1.p1 TRINITY_DN9894_c0_g1~~TRINITY_DN9894_c0_g1_i1.p1  ORF type:complete len:103 (-),score=12.60 TRINITY_DN9894_c0_g1_i1:241-507(-)